MTSERRIEPGSEDEPAEIEPPCSTPIVQHSPPQTSRSVPLRRSRGELPEQKYYTPPSARLRIAKSTTQTSSHQPILTPEQLSCTSESGNEPELSKSADSSRNLRLRKLPERQIYVPPASRLSRLSLSSPRESSHEASDVRSPSTSPPEEHSLKAETNQHDLSNCVTDAEISVIPVRSASDLLTKKPLSIGRAKTTPRQVYIPPHKRRENLLSEPDDSPNSSSNGICDKVYDPDCDPNVDPFASFRSTRNRSPSPFSRSIRVNEDEVLERLSNVIEVYDFDVSLKTADIEALFSVTSKVPLKSRVDVRWVGDTSALIRFKTCLEAEEVLLTSTSDSGSYKCCAIRDGSGAARKKALALSSELRVLSSQEANKKRPQTTDFMARQFIGRHLGLSQMIPTVRQFEDTKSKYEQSLVDTLTL